MQESPKTINVAHQSNVRINYQRQKSVGSLGEVSQQTFPQNKVYLESRVK